MRMNGSKVKDTLGYPSPKHSTEWHLIDVPSTKKQASRLQSAWRPLHYGRGVILGVQDEWVAVSLPKRGVIAVYDLDGCRN